MNTRYCFLSCITLAVVGILSSGLNAIKNYNNHSNGSSSYSDNIIKK